MCFVDGLIDHIRRHGYPGRELERRAPPLAAPDAPSQITRGASASTQTGRR
jgi:hypothetical protein